MSHPVPKCPFCGWTLRLVPYAEAYASPIRVWEAVCSNPNNPGQPGPLCEAPVNTCTGMRAISAPTSTR